MDRWIDTGRTDRRTGKMLLSYTLTMMGNDVAYHEGK